MKTIKNEKSLLAIRVSGFLLATLSILLVLFFCLGPNVPNKAHFYRSLENETIFMEKENTIDALYVGHSRVRYGVSPMEIYDEYGIVGYNCAQSLQMPWDSYQFICDVLKRQSPSVIALEVDQFFYEVANASVRSDLKKAILTSWPFYDRHYYWKNEFAQQNVLKAYTYKTSVKAGKLNDNMVVTNNKKEMSKRYKKSFEKIIKLCKKKNIQVVFFAYPTLFNWNYSMHNTIAEYAEKHNIPFIDMNVEDIAKEVGMDWEKETFDGGDHLNYKGAVKASKYLGGWLKQVTSLEDKRGQKEYEKWNKQLVDYRKKVGKEA